MMKLKKISLLILLGVIFSQAQFQITTIAKNAKEISSHKGLSAINFQKKISKNIDFDFINFPSNINYANLKYKKISLSILDYGTLTDAVDNNVLNTFNAYELKLDYYFKKNISDKFLFNSSIGIIYSQIDNYNSSAISSNLQFLTSLKKEKINFSLAINNFGIILDSYTYINEKLPLEFQFGMTHELNKTKMILGYDFIHHTNIKKNEHIFCVQFSIIESINFRLSASNFRNNLLTGNMQRDWLYGFGYGITINSDKVKSDIGISSLGDAGLIYAVSVNYQIN